MSEREAIERGDYVLFRYLPIKMEPSPILVTGIAANGLVQLQGRGWFQPDLLKKVRSPQEILASIRTKRGRGRPRKSA